jgi:hypothetical protein
VSLHFSIQKFARFCPIYKKIMLQSIALHQVSKDEDPNQRNERFAHYIPTSKLLLHSK